MPYALTTSTGHEWATQRAATLFAIFAGDLSDQKLEGIGRGFAAARADGARIAAITSPSSRASGAERRIADLVVDGPVAPSPFALFAALEQAGVDDARQLAVIGGRLDSLNAGHRAGAGAIIGVAPADPAARRHLLEAQPDVIVTPHGFADLYAARFASNRAHRERVLLNPGPSVVSDRVHRAIGGPDLCHREPEYSDILDGVKRKLLQVAGVGDDWAMVMLAGSGTAAMEAMTGAAARPGRKLLVCQNGIYGERIATISRRLGTEVVLVEAAPFQPIDPADVAAALDANPDVDAVAVIHHETTTGLLNPVEAIAAEADKRGVLVLCDAISSLGAEDLDLGAGTIDFVASTSNKCLHGLPGAAFVLVSPRGQRRIDEVPPRSLYFDLPNYLNAQGKRTVPFTPAIPALYSLDAALDELLDEGVGHRREHYQARMDFLDRELAALGLEPRVAPAHRSRSVRSLPLPEGMSYEELHDAAKAEGYVIYAGLGDSAKTSFRVCALGALKIEALQGFVTVLATTMSRRPVAVR
ncbi:MAG: pyridoxal-phosphate-dependent aminotransferase family protein [Thermomicrobiales bacterium]